MDSAQSRNIAPPSRFASIKDVEKGKQLYQLPGANIRVHEKFVELIQFLKSSAHPLKLVGENHACTHYGAALLHSVLTECMNGEVDAPPTVDAVRENGDILLHLPKKGGRQLSVPLNGTFVPLSERLADTKPFVLFRLASFGYEGSLFTSPREVGMTEYIVLTPRGNFYAVDERRKSFESPTRVPFWTMATRVLQLLGFFPSLPLLKGKRNLGQTPEEFYETTTANVTAAMDAWSSVEEVLVRFMPTEADVGTTLSEDFKAYLKSLYDESLKKATLVTCPK